MDDVWHALNRKYNYLKKIKKIKKIKKFSMMNLQC